MDQPVAPPETSRKRTTSFADDQSKTGGVKYDACTHG